MKRVNSIIGNRVNTKRNDTSDKISYHVASYIRGIINNAVSRNLNMEVKHPIYWDVLNNGWNNIEVLNINVDEEY
jgi:hypothetical protein